MKTKTCAVALTLLAVTALGACDQQGYRLVLSYPDDDTYQRARLVRLYIGEGLSCAEVAEVAPEPRLVFDAQADSPDLGEVSTGLTSFLAQISDADCQLFLSGCTETFVRSGRDTEVRIMLAALDGAGCPSGERCAGGRCQPGDAAAAVDSAVDAGTADGSRQDAARPDTTSTQDASAQDASAQDASAQDASAQDASAQDASAQDAVAQDVAASDAATASDAAGSDAALPDSAVPDTLAPDVLVGTGGACGSIDVCLPGHDCVGGFCLKLLGEDCGDETECASGVCDGTICCDRACAGQCFAGCDVDGRCQLLDGDGCDDAEDCTLADVCYDGACAGDWDMSCASFTPYTDATAAAGVGGVESSAGQWGAAYAIAWGDYDADGLQDLFLGGSGPEDPNDPNGPNLYDGLLFHNDGGGSFSRILPAPQGVRAAAWADPDNDGDLDLFTAISARLWVNEGGDTFADASSSIGLGNVENMGTVTWLDADADGAIDLFYPSGTEDPNQPPNEIRLGNGASPLSFTTYTDSGLAAAQSNGETCASADVDNDGDIDLWYNDAYDGALLLNDGTGVFSEGSAAANLVIDMASGVKPEQPYYAPVFGDYNNDGWLDLFLGHPDGVANRLYTNVTGTPGATPAFVLEVSAAFLAVDLGHSRGADWGDYDNDGDLDLALANEQWNAGATSNVAAPNALYENRGDSGFIDVGATLGIDGAAAARSTSVVFADYDNDGDLDLYFANPSSENLLWRNELDDDKYLKVRVEGLGLGGAPRDGIGTRVELWDADGTTLLAIREVSGGQGYGSQGPLLQHFGLAAAWGGGAGTYTVRARFVSGAQREVSGVMPVASTIDVGGTTLQNAIEIFE